MTKNKETYIYPDNDAYEYILDYLHSHGVHVHDMAKEAQEDQLKHNVPAKLEEYVVAIDNTLRKRDSDSLILIGIALDKACDQGALDEPLRSILEHDASLFSPDETLAVTLAMRDSGIAVTNFGARDIYKQGIAKRLDEDEEHCNVFLDDIVSALIGMAEAVVAHKYNK